MLQSYFCLRQFWLTKYIFFIHSATTYIHPRLDYRIEPKFSDCCEVYIKSLLFSNDKDSLYFGKIPFKGYCIIVFWRLSVFLKDPFVTCWERADLFTLVNVYVDLLVFMHIAGTS